MSLSLLSLLGIRHPVVLAGMAGGMTTPQLVAAVSEAGGLGTFGAAGMSVESLVEDVARSRELTDAPIGVNVLLASATPASGDADRVRAVAVKLTGDEAGAPARPSPASPRELVAAGLEAGAGVVCTGLGNPESIMDLARDVGAPVIAMVATVDDAREAVDAGADVVVAQGAEAGGHRSNFAVAEDGSVPLIGTLALVPQVVDAVDVPVIAAGGIMDGRGMAAALALGAHGVQLGTRFLTTTEASLAPSYKRRVERARDDETVVTASISGRPARGLQNELIDRFEAAGASLGYPAQQGLTAPIRARGMNDDDPERIALWAGQAAGLARPCSAAEVVTGIIEEARAVLDGLTPDD